MPEKELTGAQADRQDCVDSAIHALLNDLAIGQEIEWDMEFIGDVREVVQEIICDRLKLMTEMEFYPYIEDEDMDEGGAK
jgi:hypothetical protein